MKILKSYTAGFSRAIDSKKIVSIIYGITILFASIIAITLYSAVISKVGSRLELYKLLPDFNYTIYTDFMNNYGELIRPLAQMALWFGVLYFFFTVFFAGGILKTFEVSLVKSKAQTFFAGCAKYFFRFLRLGIYTLLIQLFFFITIAAVFSFVLGNASEASTEPQLFVIIVGWILIHLLFFILISLVSDYAKIILVKEDSKKVWSALYNGFIFAFRRIYLTLPLYILLIIIPLVLIVIYLLLDNIISTQNMLTVTIVFLMQQIFIWLRLLIKIWILGSELELFNAFIVEKNEPIVTERILMNEGM